MFLLTVKFGWSDALADMEYFYKIPRTITDAETDGWKRTERPAGALPELRMYCPPGRGVCPLYDTAGFVAGLQLAVSILFFLRIFKIVFIYLLVSSRWVPIGFGNEYRKLNISLRISISPDIWIVTDWKYDVHNTSPDGIQVLCPTHTHSLKPSYHDYST